MHPITKNILAMDDDNRYKFFIEKAIDDGEVWILTEDDYIKIYEMENGKECLPVWSTREMAEDNAKGLLEGCRPENMSLAYFMEEIIEKGIEDGSMIAPNCDVDAEEVYFIRLRFLRGDLNKEIKKKQKWYRDHERIKEASDEKADFDGFEKYLVKLNKSFRSKVDNDLYYYSPPYWMNEEDPLRKYFEGDDKIIKENGRVVYGYIWKCDDDLFDRYPREDKTALVLYSEDHEYATDPDKLRIIGAKIDGFRNSDIIPEEIKALMGEIESDGSRILNHTLPPIIAGGDKIVLTTVVVKKDHFYENKLFRRIMPLAICPEKCETSALVPHVLWIFKFTLYYTSFNEVDMISKMEPELDESLIRENDIILKQSDEDKYSHFIYTVCRRGEVWMLLNDFSIAGLQEDGGRELYLLWPTAELASMNLPEFSDGFTPASIDIYEFASKWLARFKKINCGVILYYYQGDQRSSIEVDILKLKNDIEKRILENGKRN